MVNLTDPIVNLTGPGWWSSSGGSVVAPTGPVVAPTAINNTPLAQSVVTGIDPNELANATYGRPIPLVAGGKVRMGTAGIIFGPFISAGLASFAVSFGFAANPEGTRVLYEIAFDSKVAWTLDGGFFTEDFTFRFYPGTLTQSADPLEIAEFGSEAIAYRPQMVIFFENLPIAVFGNKIPFVAALIGDTTDGADPDDGLLIGDAFERIAYSPWGGFTEDSFESVDTTDIIGAMIIASQTSFLDLLQNHVRIYRNLDIAQTDKLRVVDRGPPSVADITLNRDRILAADVSVVFTRQEPNSVARELSLVTIDPDADYSLVQSKAQRPRDPVVVSASVGKESISLPIVLGASTRQALVTYAKYQEENARKKVQFTAMAYGLEIEPGDRVGLEDLGDGFDDGLWRIIETTHGANYTVECVAETILTCALPADPYETQAVHFDGETYIRRASTLTGVSDSSTFIFSVWLHQIASGERTIIATGTNNNFWVERQTDKSILVGVFNAADPSGKHIIFGRDAPPNFAATSWTNLLIGCDVTTGAGTTAVPDTAGKLQVLINGTAVNHADPIVWHQSATGGSTSGFTIGFSSNETEFIVGAWDEITYLGDMAELYFAPGQWLDFRTIGNVRKFITPGRRPVRLGANGETPTGTAPALYLKGGSSTFGTNLGTGGAFTTTGTLTDAATSPSG